MIDVTVICLTYNHAAYIKSALEGFVNQKTSFEYEVIVHDDASIDGTQDIIREYEKEYPEIIKPIYQSQNTYCQGSNRFYTYILPKAQGRYIALCEGDDYWIDENKLQLQYDYIEQHPECSLVTNEAIWYDCSINKEKKYYEFKSDDIVNGDIKTYEVINNFVMFPIASMFFRIDFYYKHEKFLKSVDDYDYVIKTLLALDGSVHLIPRVMSVYRYNTIGSWTSRTAHNKAKNKEHLLRSIETYKRINEYTCYDHREEIEACICAREFSILLSENNYSKMKSIPYKALFSKLKLTIRIRKWLAWRIKCIASIKGKTTH